MKRPDDNPKSEFGVRKPPLSLIPGAAEVEEAMALANGAVKYGRYNWRDIPISALVYADSTMRHIRSWIDGEDYEVDPKTGIKVHHLGAARADLAILLDVISLGTLIDDRPPPGKTAERIAEIFARTESRAPDPLTTPVATTVFPAEPIVTNLCEHGVSRREICDQCLSREGVIWFPTPAMREPPPAPLFHVWKPYEKDTLPWGGKSGEAKILAVNTAERWSCREGLDGLPTPPDGYAWALDAGGHGFDFMYCLVKVSDISPSKDD